MHLGHPHQSNQKAMRHPCVYVAATTSLRTATVQPDTSDATEERSLRYLLFTRSTCRETQTSCFSNYVVLFEDIVYRVITS